MFEAVKELIDIYKRRKSVLNYGHDKTLHRTTKLNIEVDGSGQVVSVWYRCILLPFDVTVVDKNRANDMKDVYDNGVIPKLLAVDVEKKNETN